MSGAVILCILGAGVGSQWESFQSPGPIGGIPDDTCFLTIVRHTELNWIGHWPDSTWLLFCLHFRMTTNLKNTPFMLASSCSPSRKYMALCMCPPHSFTNQIQYIHALLNPLWGDKLWLSPPPFMGYRQTWGEFWQWWEEGFNFFLHTMVLIYIVSSVDIISISKCFRDPIIFQCLVPLLIVPSGPNQWAISN